MTCNTVVNLSTLTATMEVLNDTALSDLDPDHFICPKSTTTKAVVVVGGLSRPVIFIHRIVFRLPEEDPRLLQGRRLVGPDLLQGITAAAYYLHHTEIKEELLLLEEGLYPWHEHPDHLLELHLKHEPILAMNIRFRKRRWNEVDPNLVRGQCPGLPNLADGWNVLLTSTTRDTPKLPTMNHLVVDHPLVQPHPIHQTRIPQPQESSSLRFVQPAMISLE